MPFEQLVGNDAALDRLRAALDGGRPSHAYLFCGPEGTGKRTAAVDFGRALGAAPVLVEKEPKRHEIRIAQVHEIIRELNLTSDRARCVVFNDAHLMSEPAMNALLKTLEEPPANTVIVLVTHVPGRLLDTIRSRCHSIRFLALDDDRLTRFAGERLGLDVRRARAIAALSGGAPGTATTLAPQVDALLEEARDVQQQILDRDLNAVVESITKIRDTGSARETARRKLMLLALCLREGLLARPGREAALAIPPFLEYVGRLDPDDLLERIETVIDHAAQLALHANVGLVVEDALLRI